MNYDKLRHPDCDVIHYKVLENMERCWKRSLNFALCRECESCLLYIYVYLQLCRNVGIFA